MGTDFVAFIVICFFFFSPPQESWRQNFNSSINLSIIASGEGRQEWWRYSPHPQKQTQLVEVPWQRKTLSNFTLSNNHKTKQNKKTIKQKTTAMIPIPKYLDSTANPRGKKKNTKKIQQKKYIKLFLRKKKNQYRKVISIGFHTWILMNTFLFILSVLSPLTFPDTSCDILVCLDLIGNKNRPVCLLVL